MSPLSIPVAMVAAITSYIGLYHLWLHVRRPNKGDLYLAWVCGLMASYDFAALLLYAADNPAQGACFVRLQVCAVSALAVAFVRLAEARSGGELSTRVRRGLHIFTAIAVVGLVERLGLIVTDEPAIKTISTPFGTVVYNEVALGPLSYGVAATAPGVVVFSLWRLCAPSAASSTKCQPFAFAALVLMLGLLHDTLVTTGVLHGIYVAEFCWFAVLLPTTWMFSSDVVDSNQVRKTLAMTEHRIITTLNAIQDAVITTDTAGTISHLNQSAEKLLAVGLSDVLGAPLSHYIEITSSETHRVVTDPVRYAVGRPSNPFGELPQLVTTDGSERRVDIGGAPLRGDDGRVQGAVVVIRDLTVQHNAIETLQYAKKMESTGRLAGGVAHDLNNLLTPIVSYVELLERRAQPGSDEALFLGHIQDAAGRAAEVTKQLLALSRKQVLDVQVVPFSEFIRQAIPLVRQLCGESIEIKLELPQAVGQVRIDPGQMEQVLLNLAANARDAMPQGGTLSIVVRRVDEREVLMEFRDTGTGMDADTAGRIFEPFFTTKPRGKGTGLGLASVRGIVEQHGGSIYVDSEPGEGASFEIRLPTADSESPASSGKKAPEGELVGGKESILVVEDDRSVRTLIHDALTQLGYTVLTADGLVAAEIIAETEKLDLLLTDVVMPGADGPRVLEAVLKYQTVPYIYITGHADDRLGERGFVEKGTEVLRKPFSVTQLTKRVRQVLDHPTSSPSTRPRPPSHKPQAPR